MCPAFVLALCFSCVAPLYCSKAVSYRPLAIFLKLAAGLIAALNVQVSDGARSATGNKER